MLWGHERGYWQIRWACLVFGVWLPDRHTSCRRTQSKQLVKKFRRHGHTLKSCKWWQRMEWHGGWHDDSSEPLAVLLLYLCCFVAVCKDSLPALITDSWSAILWLYFCIITALYLCVWTCWSHLFSVTTQQVSGSVATCQYLLAHVRMILTFKQHLFAYANAQKKTPLEIHFIYLGNKGICCILNNASLSLFYFIFFHTNYTPFCS
jgi:hypothetical protein